MGWGRVYIDPDTTLYRNLQITGLCFLAWSYFVCLFADQTGSKARMDYLYNYYGPPIATRPRRDVDRELQILRTGFYYWFREPSAMAFHWFSLAVIILGQSWFTAIFQVLMCGINEFMVVSSDMQWRRFFAAEAFEEYFRTTGGQWVCTCTNGIARGLIANRDRDMEELRRQDEAKGLAPAATGKVVV